jgi:hypothetical protein
MRKYSLSAAIISGGLLIFFAACKQDHPTQGSGIVTLPLNSQTLDGVTLTSLGLSSLSGLGSSVVVSPMASDTDGVSNDFSGKTSWFQSGAINFSSQGSSIRLKAIDDTTISTLTFTAENDSTIQLLPIFTSQTNFHYTVDLYNGDSLVHSESNLDVNSSPISFSVNHASVAHLKENATPLWSVVTAGGTIRFINLNLAGGGACQWKYRDIIAHAVTTADNLTFSATTVVMTEQIGGGSYPYLSFDHIQEVGNCGSLRIDSVAVN